MYTVWMQDFQGVWTSEKLETKQDVFGYIAGLDGNNAVEVEGVEQVGKIITQEELEAWLNADDENPNTPLGGGSPDASIVLDAFMEKRASEPQLGDLLGVTNADYFTHGCRNYAVLRANGDGTAEVIEAQSCHDCWSVGHDADYEFARVGDVWELKHGTTRPATDSDNFAASVKFVWHWA